MNIEIGNREFESITKEEIRELITTEGYHPLNVQKINAGDVFLFNLEDRDSSNNEKTRYDCFINLDKLIMVFENKETNKVYRKNIGISGINYLIGNNFKVPLSTRKTDL